MDKRVVSTILRISVVALILLYVAGPVSAIVSAKMAKGDWSEIIDSLKPMHKKMGPNKPGDWLLYHKEEGQTFKQYTASRPVRLTAQRNILYMVSIGEFDEKSKDILKATREFMKLFYGVEVKELEGIGLDSIPDSAKRTHPIWGDEQILSTYILSSILKKKLPADGVAVIAFTPSDLWPGEDWNFVFGQAALSDRVGVWSLYRLGDPKKDKASYKQCLMRTMKVAVHETGHMFSLMHCTSYECGMCGCNSMQEADRRPVLFCPECVSKVSWATSQDPVLRYENLSTFFMSNGFTDEAAFALSSALKLREKQGYGSGPNKK